jgi:hypothetical protein
MQLFNQNTITPMKFSKLFLPLVFLSAFTIAKAQETPSDNITDEDLKKYAVTMDSVNDMKQTLSEIVTEMVQTNTVMSVPRYNELFKIANDSVKLAATKATPEEIAFLKKVEARRKEEIAKINTAYQSLAKDYVGVKTFNAIRKSLKSDQELKAKYNEISKEVAGS